MANPIRLGADRGAEVDAHRVRLQETNSYDYHLHIDVVASMFSISTFELRMYEMLGLIRREFLDGNWTYAWDQCERIALILRCREAGIRLRAVKPVIAAMEATASAEAIARGKAQAARLIKLLKDNSRANDRALDELFRVNWELAERGDFDAPDFAIESPRLSGGAR